MMQQRSETDDDARQREKAKARKERGTKGDEAVLSPFSSALMEL